MIRAIWDNTETAAFLRRVTCRLLGHTELRRWVFVGYARAESRCFRCDAPMEYWELRETGTAFGARWERVEGL